MANYNLRAIAANAVTQVLDNGLSLSTVLPELHKNIAERDRSLLQELCFGCLRVLPQLEWCLQQLMAKPLTGKQRPLHYLLMIGLYQLIYTRIPAHAAVAETVNAAVAMKRPQLKGLINGVMRQFQRQQPELLERVQNNNAHFLHPAWLLDRLKSTYPQQWQHIIEANNQRPPMWLRVNRLHHSRDHYLSLLNEQGIEASIDPDFPDALRLHEACAVQSLPGFAEGWVTVQDASAQGCVPLLDPQNGEILLDLCAAPGGKTTHILEAAPSAKVWAIDVDEVRLKKVKENLKRLNLHAHVQQGDAREPQKWAEQHLFDRILLDAPCSATGVIRRHPDIKWLRRDSDIAALAKLQKEILHAIWPYLKSGGVLLYATCSILPQENQEQIRSFLQQQNDAILCDTTIGKTGNDTHFGIQILPSVEGGDGFFYAKLKKQ